jgi:uncharacterized membrane protein
MSDTPETPLPTPPPVAPIQSELPAPPATETGLSPNIAAALAEFFSLVGGLIFYFIEKKNAFIRFHALQSAYLGAFFILINIAATILSLIPFLGVLFAVFSIVLLPLTGLAYLVVLLFATFQAFNGKEWQVPFFGKLARRHLAEGLFFFAKSPAA